MLPYHNYYLENLEERRQNRYAMVIFLPPALDEVVAPLREKYDPIYNLVESHLTLVFPFETSRTLDELVAKIQLEADRQAPITIKLESIGDFYPESPVIYWKVRQNDELDGLYYRLHSSLGLSLPFKQYHPHVTVAREISHHRVVLVKDKIVSYLPREKFVAEKMDLISPMMDNRWLSVRTFSLSGFAAL